MVVFCKSGAFLPSICWWTDEDNSFALRFPPPFFDLYLFPYQNTSPCGCGNQVSLISWRGKREMKISLELFLFLSWRGREKKNPSRFFFFFFPRNSLVLQRNFGIWVYKQKGQIVLRITPALKTYFIFFFLEFHLVCDLIFSFLFLIWHSMKSKVVFILCRWVFHAATCLTSSPSDAGTAPIYGPWTWPLRFSHCHGKMFRCYLLTIVVVDIHRQK